VELVRIAWDVLKDAAMAKHTVGKLKFDKMEDAAKLNFARYWWDKDAAVAEQVYERLTDIERGRIERLRMYQYHGNATKGVPLAEGLSSSPTYSKEATWIKADLLERTRKFTEAILAYQAADRQPDSAWRIGECLFALGKAPQALAQFQEIENFFPAHASRAAMRIARYYRETKNRPLLIAALRGIMKKYPKSGESNNAHEELEQLQVKIGGGIDAE
jgi:tetratricopeptide (TPR) repeat protein